MPFTGAAFMSLMITCRISSATPEVLGVPAVPGTMPGLSMLHDLIDGGRGYEVDLFVELIKEPQLFGAQGRIGIDDEDLFRAGRVGLYFIDVDIVEELGGILEMQGVIHRIQSVQGDLLL